MIFREPRYYPPHVVRMPADRKSLTPRQHRWVRARLVSGFALMIATAVAGVLLLNTGVNRESVGVTVLAAVLTGVFVLYFVDSDSKA